MLETFKAKIINSVKVATQKKVPVIMQMNRSECGISCLAMVLNYYGYKITLSECRDHFDIGRGGTHAKAIAQVAQKFGLDVKAYSINSAEYLSKVALPAVGHWNNNHFVVIQGVSQKKVSIIDPAIGPLDLEYLEFNKHFTNIVLTFAPNEKFEKRSHSRNLEWLNFIHASAKGARVFGLFLHVLAASIILQVVGLIGPVITRTLIDNVLPNHMINVMPTIFIGVLLIALFNITIRYLRSILLVNLQIRLDSQLMTSFFEHLLALPYSFFLRRSHGDIMVRLNSNIVIREILMSQTLSILLDGGLTIVYLTILLIAEPVFGFFTLIIGFLNIVVTVVPTSKINRLSVQDLVAQSNVQSYLVEALTSIKYLKATGKEDFIFEDWLGLYFKQLDISTERSYLTAVVNSITTGILGFSTLGLTWLGITFVLQDSMSLGTVLALVAIASSVLYPLSTLISQVQGLQVIGAHISRLEDVIQTEPEQERQLRKKPKFTGNIELRNVTFEYPLDEFRLDNVSIEVKSGQKVAIVGESGSGKSTLAMIMLGLYNPSKGLIFYDNIPLHTVDYKFLRSQIGAVLQDQFLLNASIQENICFGNPQVSQENIIQAAKAACIHDAIMQMPLAYLTPVGEGGANLSGGQIQRLSLARAIVSNPKILLLDEATNSVDSISENKIHQNLDLLKCTRIIISHRLSTIQDAHQIIVLKNGKIVGLGTHEMLLQNEHYFELVRAQMGNDMNIQKSRHENKSIWNI